MHRLALAVLAVAAGTLVLAAPQDDKPQPKKPPVAALLKANTDELGKPHDKDADGRLTRDELKGTPWADRFDDIDANKDGKIDRKEFEAYLKRQEERKKP